MGFVRYFSSERVARLVSRLASDKKRAIPLLTKGGGKKGEGKGLHDLGGMGFWAWVQGRFEKVLGRGMWVGCGKGK